MINTKRSKKKIIETENIELRAKKKEERLLLWISELEKRMATLDSSMKKVKNIQNNEKQIREQTIKIEKLEDVVTEIQEQLKRSVVEAKEPTRRNVQNTRRRNKNLQ